MPSASVFTIVVLGLTSLFLAGVGVFVWLLHKARERIRQIESQRIEVLEHQRLLNRELAECRELIEKGEWTDRLTGLPSRQMFEDRLSLALNQSARYQQTFCVMCLNLDHFRVVNDALGLEAGDFILKKVGERLQESMRELDTPSRFAGDEFVLLFPQINRAETAGYIAQRILDRLSHPYEVNGENVWLTASIGIAVFPMDGKDGSSLIQNAENALHQAKAHGRNTYQFYRKEMHALGKRELMLGAGLHNELLFHDFTLTWRPEINVPLGKIVCMDACVQWQHSDFGPVTLPEFVHLAENSGRITDIGEWAVRTAIQDLLAWREKGLPMTAIMLPLSLKQLEKMRFVHFLSTTLQEYRLEPELFVFEISDTSGLLHVEAIEKMLGMMKHLGVRIAINGLGTEHLSLQRLHQLPFNILRIDGGLVSNISHDKESREMAKMIVALAKSLNVTLVAEGVESAGQKNTLLEIGCNIMQGGLFSAPIAGHQYTAEWAESIGKELLQPVS